MPSRTSKLIEKVDPDPTTLSGLIERERSASESGIAMLDRCIAETERMLASGEYDSKVASHLAWILDKRTQSVSKLRQFGERVKTQSSELTPEQQRRAVAKFIQNLPATVRDEFRALLDTPINDIELIS